MTVAELGERMSSDEFTRWRAFHAYRHALEEKAAKRSKRGR